MAKAVKEGISFRRENYILILSGIVALIVGFILLSGGGSEDPNAFDESIFNARRLTVAPLILMGGYILVLFGILKKPKQQDA